MVTLAAWIVVGVALLALLPVLLPILAIAFGLTLYAGATFLLVLLSSEVISGAIKRPLSLSEIAALFILCGGVVAFGAWRALGHSVRKP